MEPRCRRVPDVQWFKTGQIANWLNVQDFAKWDQTVQIYMQLGTVEQYYLSDEEDYDFCPGKKKFCIV